MKEKYFFGIKGQKIGPLDEESIRQRLREGTITAETLSWCNGMEKWLPVNQIPELKEAFGEFLAKQVVPPDLPPSQSSVGQQTPPPLPEGLSPFEASCYRFTKVCFRPCFGFQSPLGKMVEKNPKSAVGVVIGTVCLMVVIIFMAISGSKQSGQQVAAPGAGQQQQAAQSGPGWGAQYQAIRSAQQFGDNVIDDTYKYRRDSQDRMDETYKRANYDWYKHDD
ncbi:MAG: DUF4339 domain-containing protein [Candidatus Omnitrophica bacterium]|nr:DUF4339 domain-containing protein [Candidatus Omnitrophota bacterium]